MVMVTDVVPEPAAIEDGVKTQLDSLSVASLGANEQLNVTLSSKVAELVGLAEKL
jgi:hypothetical protein